VKIKTKLPGIGIAVITGLAALFLSEHYNAPAMLFALLLGIAMSFLYLESPCKEGIEFSSSTILRVGIALLGLRIALNDLLSLGWQTIGLLIVAISTTILIGMYLAKKLGFNKRFGALTGGSVAICGASAAMAITAIMPEYKDKERDTLVTVIGVTSLSTIAMIAYPIIATYLRLDSDQAGLFLGGTIHDVAQVVGAGYSLSEETGNTSTLVKLVRVSLLMPVVLCMLFFIKRFCDSAKGTSSNTPFPVFLIAFVVLMLINSFIDIPPVITEAATTISRFALITAITAIGMKSNLAKLSSIGPRPIFIMLFETLWIALFILGTILLG